MPRSSLRTLPFFLSMLVTLGLLAYRIASDPDLVHARTLLHAHTGERVVVPSNIL